MVENSVTDGRRIAQLLASELIGLDRGSLAAVDVADAVRGVEPSPGGARAYDVAADGDRLATVAITESTARVAFERPVDLALPDRDHGLRLERDAGDEGPVLVVEQGAAVKRAADAVATALE